MVEIENEEKLKYSQLVEFLNVIRSRELISAKQRREYDKRWREHPEHRELILEELERLMEEHSEQIIQEKKET